MAGQVQRQHGGGEGGTCEHAPPGVKIRGKAVQQDEGDPFPLSQPDGVQGGGQGGGQGCQMGLDVLSLHPPVRTGPGQAIKADPGIGCHATGQRGGVWGVPARDGGIKGLICNDSCQIVNTLFMRHRCVVRCPFAHCMDHRHRRPDIHLCALCR